MDVRAKLLELILEHNSHHVVICDSCLCDTPEEHYSKIHGLIDFLVSNGVTIDPASLRPKAFWEEYATSSFYGYDDNHEPKWAARKFYRCESCRKGTAVKSNFCPNCGADMRAEVASDIMMRPLEDNNDH